MRRGLDRVRRRRALSGRGRALAAEARGRFEGRRRLAYRQRAALAAAGGDLDRQRPEQRSSAAGSASRLRRHAQPHGGKVEFRRGTGRERHPQWTPFDHGPIHSDADGHPDTLAVGDVKLILLKRGERLAVRHQGQPESAPRQLRRAALVSVREDWRIQARFVAAPAATKLKMDTIVGESDGDGKPRRCDVRADGKAYQPAGGGQKDGRLWFVFRDGTSGRTTHGGARQLYAEPPRDGVVVLDFNKATNFPCAYIPYATCPLAPASEPVEPGDRGRGAQV